MAARRRSEPLALYRNKRDFRTTPEPSGTDKSRWKKRRNPIFVVHKHDATRLHYDFRLEIGGVLKSWAVPKGPSMNPADKRLAVETEDHPLDYADFEGVIPEGEYGAGTVIVWDTGPLRNLKTDERCREIPLAASYRKGRIEVWLEGKKLRGGFALIHNRMGGEERHWLLVKMDDEAADRRRNPVSTEPRSVLSGRTIAGVARDARHAGGG
jgi:DNA ligase D-like protein (predicted 3'-phosphoesterase)